MRLTRALALFALALSACAPAEAGGFPWKRPIVAAGGGGGGSPTNVRRFGSAGISTGGTTTADYTIGSVSVGDLVVFLATQTTAGVISGVTENLGNTLNLRQTITDSTYGPFRVYDTIVTSAGTLTVTVTASGNFSTVAVVGEQWNGVTFTYDTSSQNNATNTGLGVQYTDQYAPSYTAGGNRLVLGCFGNTGVAANAAPTPDAGWSIANGSGAGSTTGLACVDKLIGASTVQPHVAYASFSYAGGVTTAYSY